jgi:hypothetical protein
MHLNYVTNLSQGYLGVRTTRGERNLEVADGHKAKVEAVGTPHISSS